MLSQPEMKRLAAEAAVEYVVGHSVIGVGSGTTADAFIDALAASGIALSGVVPASDASAVRLADAGFHVLDLNDVGTLPLYVDGADEADGQLRLVKGAGGALAREKVIASASERFVCVVDETKFAERLGRVPVPVEVLPLSAAFVADRLRRLGGKPVLREGYVTDNANLILDVTGLPVEYPETLERTIAVVPGVVESGVFALRPADVLIVATASGQVRRLGRRP